MSIKGSAFLRIDLRMIENPKKLRTKVKVNPISFSKKFIPFYLVFKMAKRKSDNISVAGTSAKIIKSSAESEENDDSDGSGEDDEENSHYMTIKMTLRQILKTEYQEQLTQIITEHSLKATKIYCLASSFILYKVNHAIDHKNFQIFNTSVTEFVSNCFYGVLGQYTDTEFMSAEFAAMYQGNWPNNDRMGNSFKYLFEQYETSFMNTFIGKKNCYVSKISKSL